MKFMKSIKLATMWKFWMQNHCKIVKLESVEFMGHHRLHFQLYRLLLNTSCHELFKYVCNRKVAIEKRAACACVNAPSIQQSVSQPICGCRWVQMQILCRLWKWIRSERNLSLSFRIFSLFFLCCLMWWSRMCGGARLWTLMSRF